MATAAQSVKFCEDDVHKLEPLVSRNAIRERQRAALRLHVGRGRRYSVKELSEGAGVPERTIEAAMAFIDDENYRPLALENVASIAKFLGAASPRITWNCRASAPSSSWMVSRRSRMCW
jgi:hypothetical protein